MATLHLSESIYIFWGKLTSSFCVLTVYRFDPIHESKCSILLNFNLPFKIQHESDMTQNKTKKETKIEVADMAVYCDYIRFVVYFT